MSQRRQEGGFTLIELMIVVVICGILAAIIIPNYAAKQMRDHEKGARRNAIAVQQFANQYAADYGYYPADSVVAKHFFDEGMRNPAGGNDALMVPARFAECRVAYATSGNPADHYEIHAYGTSQYAGENGDGVIAILSAALPTKSVTTRDEMEEPLFVYTYNPVFEGATVSLWSNSGIYRLVLRERRDVPWTVEMPMKSAFSYTGSIEGSWTLFVHYRNGRWTMFRGNGGINRNTSFFLHVHTGGEPSLYVNSGAGEVRRTPINI